MFDWTGRLARLAEFRDSQGLDALVISCAVNIRYLTGFSGSSGLFVSARGGESLVTDGRYESFVRESMRSGAMALVDLLRVETRYDQALGAHLRRLQPERVGFEAEHVTVATLRHWQEAATLGKWVETSRAVERMRLIKDAAELAVLRRGGQSLSGVARSLDSWVRAGRTEREVAGDIDRALEHAGFERPAFETIVAGGPNSAYPHARPTDRRLVAGDLVVLDFGGVLDGYCVDLTRMAAVGSVGAQARQLYVAVRDAQAAALRAIRAGVRATEVDTAARQVLEAAGLGEAFVHGTGHGLGLEVHEAPRLARPSSGVIDELEPGMVCTVEPGAYVEGVGGVRLEDDVVVTIGGSELLTDVPQDLLVV